MQIIELQCTQSCISMIQSVRILYSLTFFLYQVQNQMSEIVCRAVVTETEKPKVEESKIFEKLKLHIQVKRVGKLIKCK